MPKYLKRAEHRKRWQISWKGVAAFTSLLAGGSLFGLYEEYAHSEFMRAWVSGHRLVATMAALYGAFTIAGIVASCLARRDIPEVDKKNENDKQEEE